MSSLAFQITPTGITAPALQDILASMTASFQSIYGSDARLTPDSQDGQWIAIFATAINDINQSAIALYNGFAPSFSQGVMLSILVKINGLLRQIPTNSTALVILVGSAGTVISNGVVQDSNGNLWDLPPLVTIPNSGTVDVTVTAQVTGNIVALANSITIIATPTLGWQSVTNPSDAIPGNPVELDGALRQRQAKSVSLPAQTTLQAIFGAIANIAGVSRLVIYENPTGITDSNGVPGHSISVVVQGGDATTIAQTIEAKKSPGTGTFGSTSVTVNDPAGVPVTINFFTPPTFVPIFVSITIHPLNGFVSSTSTVVANAIVNFINNLAIGQKVAYNWLVGVASLIGNPLQPTFEVTALTSGITPSPTGTTDINIAFNAAATCILADVIVTVS